MKTILLLCSLLFAATASAQWQTTNYSLKGGWNSIYLHGDASHAEMADLFPNTGVTANVAEVWRWNPNPTQVQFTSSPLNPSAGTPEWSTWVRIDPSSSTLTTMTGPGAYLIKCDGASTTTYTLPLKQRAKPPASTWVRNGANFLGFPSFRNGANFPAMSTYFATFAAAVSSNTKIYKYVGGDLGTGNPLQVFSPTFEQVNRNQAYWFEAEVVGTFYAPIEITPSLSAGLEFGRTGSEIVVRLRNRTSAAVTMTVSQVASAQAPAGQDGIVGDAPLTRRIYNTATLEWDEPLITAGFTVPLAPLATVELSFGVKRSLMMGAPGSFYASMLSFRDSSNQMEVFLPASARVGSLAGLWVGDAQVTDVVSTVPGSPGSTTKQAFPLRYLIHVDENNVARVLSQVFMGKLAAAPHLLGLTTTESGLKADEKATARRMVSTHLPLDLVLNTGTGSFALGSTLGRTISVPFDDTTNPFVHKYHPDHDNRDARFQPVLARVESYTVTRLVSFEFKTTPPVGTASTGWGSTVMGGNYSETITGAHKLPLTVTGTFTLRRLSEDGVLTP
jgi:hypothetical protein